MKILIVRLSALGDIVHALPVLAAIKKAKPDAQVDWLVEENYASILSIASGLRRRVIVRASRSFETPDAVSFGGLLGYRNARHAFVEPGLRRRARSAGPDQVGGVGAHLVREPRHRIRRRQPARAAGCLSLFGNGDAAERAGRPTGQQASRRSRHSEESIDPLGACRSRRTRSSCRWRRRLAPRSIAAIDAAGGPAPLHRPQSGRGVAEQALAARSFRRAGGGASRSHRTADRSSPGDHRSAISRTRSCTRHHGAATAAPRDIGFRSRAC